VRLEEKEEEEEQEEEEEELVSSSLLEVSMYVLLKTNANATAWWRPVV